MDTMDIFSIIDCMHHSYYYGKIVNSSPNGLIATTIQTQNDDGERIIVVVLYIIGSIIACCILGVTINKFVNIVMMRQDGSKLENFTQ